MQSEKIEWVQMENVIKVQFVSSISPPNNWILVFIHHALYSMCMRFIKFKLHETENASQ